VERPAPILAITVLILSLSPAASSQEPSPGPPTGPVIRSQSFPGRTWIPERQIEGILGLRAGDRFTAEGAAEALRRLLAWKFIDAAWAPEAEANPDGTVDIAWRIRERLLVVSIHILPRSVRRRGSPIPPSELIPLIETRRGEPLDRAALDRDREAIRKKHIAEGFSLCEVTADAREVRPGAAEVVFVVEDGPEVSISEIEIAGSRAVPERLIRAVMESRPRLLFGLLAGGRYDPERFAADVERVRAFYRARGFLEATLAPLPVEFSPDLKRIKLGLAIDEGPRYMLSGTEIEGNGPGVPTSLLLKQIRSITGRTYDGVVLEEDRQRLVRWYQEHYDRIPIVEIRHRFAIEAADHRATAIFAIDEREHLQTGPVSIEGNFFTRDRVIRSRLAVVPGDPLTALALESSARQLASTGYFVPEKVSVAAPPAGDERSVEVSVEERRAGLLQVGGGASSGEGEVAYVGITQTNFDITAIPGPHRAWKDIFSGGGQLLQVEWVPGTRQSELFLRFEEPYLYNTRHKLSIVAGGQSYDRRSYEEARLRGEIGLTRIWDEARWFSTRLGYTIEEVDISDLSAGVPSDVSGVEGRTFLAYPTVRATWSTLEPDFFRGPAGVLAEARGDVADGATGSEVDFVRARLSFELFQPVTSWWNRVLPGRPLSDHPSRLHILRFGGRFGWADGTGGDDVPIFERYFLGGPRSLRGFEYRDVGPTVQGTRVGGRGLIAGTVEYSFPLAVPELRAIAYFDYGDLETELNDIALHRFRTAAGGGVRIRTRIFGQPVPLDLYWTAPLAKERDDDVEIFSFTLGLGF